MLDRRRSGTFVLLLLSGLSSTRVLAIGPVPSELLVLALLIIEQHRHLVQYDLALLGQLDLLSPRVREARRELLLQAVVTLALV